MKGLLFLFLFLLSSCGHIEPERSIASTPVIDKNVQPIAEAKFFSDEAKNEISLFLETKDAKSQSIDIDMDLVHLRRVGSKKNLERKIQRANKGQYYIRWKAFSSKEEIVLDVIYNKKKILSSLVYKNEEKADFKKSSLTIKKREHTTFDLELKLVNKNNKPLKVFITPEIILEGSGHLSELKQTGPGVWHFSVVIPQENQILYFGVQLNGQRGGRLLRFQHVEQ